MKSGLGVLVAAMAAFSAVAMTRPKAPNDVVDGVEMFSIADETGRQTVIAEGTDCIYQGHPTMCRTADGKRLLTVWTLGHGGHDEPLAESSDGGRTWMRVDDRLPAIFKTHHNCPSVYRMKDAAGKDRIWIFSARKEEPGKPRAWMPRVVSEDDGYTWREEPPLGPSFWNIMTFSSVVALKEPGHYLAVYHRGPAEMQDRPPMAIWASETCDGGFTWSEPRRIATLGELAPCEPWVFRSPKGDELCCVLRENVKSNPSYFVTSRDEGRTWTAPKSLPWILAMHRHQGVRLKDGRLCVLGRCWGRRSATSDWRENVMFKKFGAWIGTYEQLKGEAPLDGSKAIALLPNYHDCDTGYPGVVLMDDGSVVCCTYGWYFPDMKVHKCSVVSTRFHPDEFGPAKPAVKAPEMAILPLGAVKPADACPVDMTAWRDYWRARRTALDESIVRLRQRDYVLELKDANGALLTNAAVEVRQMSSDLIWGYGGSSPASGTHRSARRRTRTAGLASAGSPAGTRRFTGTRRATAS